MSNHIEKTIFYLTVLLLAISTLLSVRAGWDNWVPFIQAALVGIILFGTIWRISLVGGENSSPIMIPLLLLTIWAGASFFLPSIMLRRAIP